MGLYRAGTRVLERINDLEALGNGVWASGYLQGIVDVPYLQITPGTRSGIVRDGAFMAFCESMKPLEEEHLVYRWECVEGQGRLEPVDSEIVTFHAPPEPGLTRVRAVVRQHQVTCEAEALITVTDSLLPGRRDGLENRQGLPGYTYHRAPGELWRSRYDAEKNLIVINNGHRDFVFASRSKALKLRYICRLFAKELVVKNFPGLAADQLLERMIELTLHTEEHLK